MSAVLHAAPAPSGRSSPVQRTYEPVPGLRERVMSALMRTSLRLMFKPVIKPPMPVGLQRAVLHTLSVSMPPGGGVKVEHIRIGNMAAERITPKATPKPKHAMLYLHGGAFCAGSPRSHRSITTRLSRMADCEVLAIHYRRVPEHPFPAQIEDSVAGYKALLERGYRPEHIAVGGDSAGGTLTLLVFKALELAGLPTPKCLVMMSPAFDAKLNSDSVKKYKKLDPMINIEWGMQGFAWYRPQHDHPLAFPKRQDLSTLPPTLVQVGEIEVLHDDSVWLLHAAKRFDRPVELEVYKGRWHVFQIHAGLMPSATQALARQAAFMKLHWGA
ncbi:alpha/beta hydrolase [uncultured Aquabacterium sp.]|uniref:alpha/beta hydrolase n=1 Tax=Aquabacterium sp. TaxID=1872578 RepID=UPI0025D2EE9D|nr:alpha/beta hydrolase [uncultured Aquabacterium sp.]